MGENEHFQDMLKPKVFKLSLFIFLSFILRGLFLLETFQVQFPFQMAISEFNIKR